MPSIDKKIRQSIGSLYETLIIGRREAGRRIPTYLLWSFGDIENVAASMKMHLRVAIADVDRRRDHVFYGLKRTAGSKSTE